MESMKFVSVIAMMVILFIGNVNAGMLEESHCIQACYDKCRGGTMACFFRCIAGCPGAALARQDLDHQYYCKLGCTYDQCLKHGNGKSKIGNCLNHCENMICNIKPPAPSPAPVNVA
uniref:protein TAP1 n=1 Tax=Fragaria vesca subsp. vesca TaxID=101020 RepID=UPI0005CA1F3C|nr:PREDICTED: protein TAP1 [Fragaria vesca subsp. vesca]